MTNNPLKLKMVTDAEVRAHNEILEVLKKYEPEMDPIRRLALTAYISGQMFAMCVVQVAEADYGVVFKVLEDNTALGSNSVASAMEDHIPQETIQ